MNNKNIRGQWVGCSNLTDRVNELRAAHEEFLKVKDALEEGFKIKDARVKRPRIQKVKTPRKVVISVLGNKTTITYQEYLDRCQGFKIIMEIF